MKKYYFLLNREYFRGREYLEPARVLMIDSLLFGMCTFPCNTEVFDIEISDDFVIYAVECDEYHYKKCVDSIKKIYYPDINNFLTIANLRIRVRVKGE